MYDKNVFCKNRICDSRMLGSRTRLCVSFTRACDSSSRGWAGGARQGEVGRRGDRSVVDWRAGVAPRTAVRRAGVRVDGERVASGSHGARVCPSPSGGARAGDGARAGNGGVAVDGGRGVGRGDRPSAVEGSVDGEALARGACSVLPNLRVVM